MVGARLGGDPSFRKYFPKFALSAKREKFPEISPAGWYRFTQTFTWTHADLWLSPDPFHEGRAIYYSERNGRYMNDLSEPIWFIVTVPHDAGVPLQQKTQHRLGRAARADRWENSLILRSSGMPTRDLRVSEEISGNIA